MSVAPSSMDKITQQVVIVTASTKNIEANVRHRLEPLFEQGWHITSTQMVGEANYRTAMFVLSQNATVGA